jgi:hypothetical protein
MKNCLSEKTVLVVFPSIYSLNKLNKLAINISRILKMKNQSFDRIRKNKSVIIVEASDPVLASSVVSMLFGIDRIAIAKEVESNFQSVLSDITSTAMNLLLKGERFYVKIEGKTKNFQAKDLEISATSALIEKSADFGAKPGSAQNYDRLVYSYLTDSYAYVCIFVDQGLGGLPYSSNKEKILCCIYDELSAISCLQTIKMGFEVKILICYRNEQDLLKLTKMINRILPRIIEEQVTLHICRLTRSSSLLTTITIITQIMVSIALKEDIKRIAVGISPMIFPVSFSEFTAELIFHRKLIPWFPLTGIDLGILENAKELGLEKYLSSLKALCLKRFSGEKVLKSEALKNTKNAFETIKCVSVTSGPKNIHDIIDLLKSDH